MLNLKIINYFVQIRSNVIQTVSFHFFFIAIARVALDVRLGCLDDDANIETQQLIDAVTTFFKNVGILELKIPFWKLFNTPTWLKYVNALDTILR